MSTTPEHHKLTDPLWYQHMAAVSAAIGKEEFGERLLNACRFLANIYAPVLIIYPHHGSPITAYSPDDDSNWGPMASMEYYIEGAYLLDPFYQASIEGCPSNLYRLNEIVPDLFHKTDYYFNYYQHCKLVDELNFLVQLPNEQTASLSLANNMPFNEQEVEFFRLIAPWVVSVIQSHFTAAPKKETGPSFHQNLASAFQNFGSSVLTSRECEIAQHILHGYSTKAMANKLNISMETVKVHRRHLYQKLDISSQPELFSLFINSLASGDKPLGQDPLQDYF